MSSRRTSKPSVQQRQQPVPTESMKSLRRRLTESRIVGEEPEEQDQQEEIIVEEDSSDEEVSVESESSDEEDRSRWPVSPQIYKKVVYYRPQAKAPKGKKAGQTKP